MAGKPLKKSSVPGVSIQQLVEKIPEGCSMPDFQQKPVTLALQEGKNAIFQAVVCGEPRPKVHWERTKGDLSDPSKYQISSAPGSKEHVLQINKLTGEDTDLYRCRAVNMCGEASCSARLTVIEVGFRKSRKRQNEPPEDLRKELIDFRKMLKKRAPLPAPEKKIDLEQVWQLLMTADRKDYERICMKYGVVDYRGMLHELQVMPKEREVKMAQYINAIFNLRHIKVTKDGIATFDLELDLKSPESKIYLYKDGEMIPFGFDNQTKHCLRQLGKRYHFQIRDLQPEDAGIYQVRVEDAEVFSTELEASTIPPRVVVPLTEVRCQQQERAVFECILSSPCPNATWHFQHRPFQPSDKYEVTVSPDGLTHRLVVKGAHFSDMGLYSLVTGLHASSAWLVVEAGKDKGLLTTSDDRQLQAPGAQVSEAEDSGRMSGEGGKPREQDPMGSSLKGAGLTSRLQLTASPERGGFSGHGYSLMGNEGTADSAWGPGQVREGFPEAKGGRVTLPGESQLHREGGRSRSLPRKPHLQDEGPDSGFGLMEGQQEDHGRDSDGDRCWGSSGGWEAGSRPPQAGELGGTWEGKEHREDKQGQEQLWDAQLGPRVERRALLESQFDPVGSLLTGEVMERDGLDKMEGRNGLSRGRGRGRGEPRAVWGYGTGLGEPGDISGTGDPGILGSPGGRGSSSKAGMGPGSLDSRRGRDSDPGRAGVHSESGESLGQTFGGKGFQEPSISGGRKFPLGGRSTEAKAEGSLREADDGALGQSVVEGRGYKTGSGGSGGPGDWKDNLQEHRGRGLGCKDGQETAGPSHGTEDDSRSLQSSQGWIADQRGTKGTGNIAADSTGQTRAHSGPGVLGPSGGKGDVSGMGGAQDAELMRSGQGVDARSHRLVGSSGLDAQGSGGTLGDTNGSRGPRAIRSESDFWNGSWGSRGKGPRDEMGCMDGLGGLEGMDSTYGNSLGYSRGIGPRNGAAYSDGSGVVVGEMGSGQGAGYRVTSGAPGGIESEEGSGYRHSSGVPGEMWSGDKDGYDVDRRGSGRVGSFKNGPGSAGGGPMGAVGHRDTSRGQGEIGPQGGSLGSSGTVGSVSRGGLGASEAFEDRHVGAEPGVRPWGQTGDCGVFRTSGTLGSFGEGGYEDGSGDPEAMEPGSLRAGGKVDDGGGPRGPGARASGPGTGCWDDTRYPEALPSHDGVGSESQWAYGSDSILGCGDRSGIPGPQGTGGRTAYGEGSRSLELGGPGPGGEAGFRDGSGGLRGMGPGGEAGFRDGSGGLRGMGSGCEAGFRDGSGGLRGMGSGGEAGFRDGSGGLRGMGSGGEAGFRDGSGGLRGVGSGGEAGFRDGSRGLRGIRPGGEADFRDGSGGLGGMRLGGEAGYRSGIGSSGEMRSVGKTSYRKDLGVPEGMGSGRKEDYRNGLGAPGKIGSKGEGSYRNELGGPGRFTLCETDCRDGLRDSGHTLSRSEEGYRGVLEGTKGMAPGGKGGYRGGPGGSGEMGAVGEKGSGTLGVTGSLAGMGYEGRSKSQDAMEQGSGYRVASEASHGSTSSMDSPESGRGTRLVNGAAPGVGSGMVGLQRSAVGTTHRDSPRGPGPLGTQGGPETFSDGQGSRDGLGGCGTSGTLEALGAVDSKGKSGVSEWQNGSGIPGSPRDQEAPSEEGRPAERAGAMGPSGLFDGSQGSVEGENQTGTAALESRHERDFGRADPRIADRGGAAGQGEWAPQGGGDSVRGGRRMGAGWGSSAGPGQALDSSSAPCGRDKSALGGADGQGLSSAWVPGWEGEGHGQGSRGTENRLPSSRVSRSLQERDAIFCGTHGSPGSSRGMEGAPGQEEAGGCQDPQSLDSKDSGPGRDLDSQQGKGQRGRSGALGEQGSLEGEKDKAQGPGALKENEGQGAEDSGGSDRRAGSFRSRSQTQSGAEVGVAQSRGAEEAQDLGHPRGGESRGHQGETEGEDQSQEPPSHLGSKRGGTIGRANVYGEGADARQSPGSGHKPGTGSFSKEARVPRGHFSQGLADTEAKQGEATMLSCTLTRDLGPGAWFKDGVKLTAQDGVIFEQDSLVHRLLIACVQGTQAGRYTFVAGNQQSEATLTVHEKLREPLVVKAGKPVAVKIPFESRLPVQATWRKDRAVVLDGSSGGVQVALGDGFTRLCLPSASRKDRGEYSVMLRSDGGSAQAELTLQVIDKPQPPQGPLEVQDGHRAGVCLRWQAPHDDGGRAIQHYVVERRQAGRSAWLKVGEPPTDSTTFTDAHVEQGRKYAFRVFAVTSEGAGEALQSEEVLVAPEALPRPPSAPAILSASSQGITLTWTAPQGPGSAHLLGYLIEKRKKGSNTWMAVNHQPVPGPIKVGLMWGGLFTERKWTVVDLWQGCQYEFRVTAVAPPGPGEPGPPSEAVFARDPMRPPGPVWNLQVIDTPNTSITLSWARPDTQDGDEALGYVVELCGSHSLQWSPCHTGTVAETTYTAKGLRAREGYFVRVTAVNDGGRGQPTALDTLVQAMPISVHPKFLKDSSTKDLLTVRAGDTVRVPVPFEAAPLPEVTWLKDGLPLPKRSVTITKDSLTQLLIPVASLSDSGLYTVVLRNLQGKEATYNFHVRVAACPRAPGPIHLQENVPGTVTAEWEPSPDEAEAGGGPLHYTVLTRSAAKGSWWEVADRVHTNRFTLLNVLPGHEYHFRVVAKNELGASRPSDTRQPWYIPRRRGRFTVKAPSYQEPNLSQKPWFLVGLRVHLLPQGSECCMSCAVRGSPRPHVTWFKDDQSLEGNPAVYSTNVLGVCSLIIPSVSLKDSGQYKAVAENTLGQAVSTATVIVIESSS